MSKWHDTAIQLDHIYSQAPQIARRQIKNQPQLLVLDGTHYKFFPIRRLADGIEGRAMDAPKCQAQEIQRYRHSLRSSGFREVTENEAEHEDLLSELVRILQDQFEDRPSPSMKTFWIPNLTIKEAILNAFQKYDEYGTPEGFGEARTWYVSHPETEKAYPAKIIWGLATNKEGVEFISHQARDGLRKAGFECADLSTISEADFTPEQLREGSVREVVQVRRERNPVARALCIEHYRNMNNGKLLCSVCDFDFADFYGPLGEGFMHVHHLDPISEARSSRNVSPEFDLVPVCPNCHSMIHRGGENRSISEMRQTLRRS